jgi:hypothetical protein
LRRTLLSLLALCIVLLGAPVGGHPGHQRPKITKFGFAQQALKSGIDETLIVVAHDPDSWISEIQVQWEDQAQNGGVVFAHTFCVQDPDYSDPGTVAKLKIPIFFDQPGKYHVEARAISEIECQGGNQTKTSKTLEMDVTVKDPLKSFSDPDDTAGGLDIAALEQTQESSMTSATTEIVHRITMVEDWTNDALAGPAYMELYFDLDGEADSFERILTIDLDAEEGTLWASMLDPTTGQGRGYAAVSRPDGKTIEVRVPPLLLKRGVDSYRWYAYVDGGQFDLCPTGESCTDRAPDQGLIVHKL